MWVKYVALGTLGAGGLLYGACEYSDIKSTGIIRFGRAGFTIASIAKDYRRTMIRYPEGHEDRPLQMSSCHTRSALKLRNLCCQNGGCFIKVGQHLGALDYLLPDEYVSTLRVLHDRAPKATLENIREVFRHEFHAEIEDVFVDFAEEPIGAASLAQVHFAKLKDGREVAVKVQHKEVLRYSSMDMACMKVLAKAIAYLFPKFQFMWLVDETKKNLPLELDFLHEGKNAEELGQRMKRFSGFLKIPKVYWDMSTSRVLVMEYCPGLRIDDKKGILGAHMNPKEVSDKLTKLYSTMIFREGFIHCDPHPGNILVRPKLRQAEEPFFNKVSSTLWSVVSFKWLQDWVYPTKNCEIVILDHGLYQTLTDEFRLSYCRLWMHILHGDLGGIKEESTNLGCGHLYSIFACMVSGRSWKALQMGLRGRPITKEEQEQVRTNAGFYLPEISDVLNSVPRQMLLIFKCNDLLRGVSSALGTQSVAYGSTFTIMSRVCAKALWLARWRQLVLSPDATRLSFFSNALWLQWEYLRIVCGALLMRVMVSFGFW